MTILSKLIVPRTLLVASLVSSCVATGPWRSSEDVAWRPVICVETTAAIERIRCGKLDPREAVPHAAAVDQAGDVAWIAFDGGTPRAETIYRHDGELTGLAIGDVDPLVPGAEIYVGGRRGGGLPEEAGGAVVQLVVDARANVRVRRLLECSAYVHSIERVPTRADGSGGGLLVCTYRGEIHRLTPTPGAGPWRDEVLWADAPAQDVETPKIKDAAFLVRADGSPTNEALVAFKTGRLAWIDVERPGSFRVIHEEAGGLSRVTPAPDGSAYVTGYAGRLLHVTRSGGDFQVAVLAQEGVDSGLRGAVLGRFPVSSRTRSGLVVFGFHKRCRALVERLGVLDPVTLYVDVDRGHTVEAADLVPGNDADELLVGGYSKRVTLLVPGPAPR